MKIKRLLAFFLIIGFLVLLAYYYPKFSGQAISDSNINYQREEVFVNRVIDGDTIEADRGTIRLLGVNTKSIQSS